MKKVRIGVLGGYRGKTMINWCVVNRELADVAAREEERGDDEAVGGKDELFRAGKDRAVAQRLERRVGKGGQQHIFDQPRGLFSPAAVVERDDLVHFK